MCFSGVEDVVDLSLVKTGLATLLQKNTMAAMDGIFSQVSGREDTGREGKGKGVFLIRVLHLSIHVSMVYSVSFRGQSSILGM